ncbi:cytosolic tryparedoxin peroxidase, trypanosomatid typical 2-Cys peroxiredoxin [Planctomycetaceae bacterium]|nr:cytosolic tryparedoxin peroxidase, trypanosomatid typical 2-Cys peroxiredoxin [Planctomycetaceae bacterium]
MAIAIGQKAPSFSGRAYIQGTTKDIKLEDFKGKWVVLFFYPLAFTSVCSTELPGFQEKLAEFEKLGAVVIGCSVDSVPALKAWVESGQLPGGLKKIDYALLGDLTKNVARDYNVLNEQTGFSGRGTFIINPEGVLMQYSVNSTPIGRDVDSVLRELAALVTGKACPANWQAGQPTM